MKQVKHEKTQVKYVFDDMQPMVCYTLANIALCNGTNDAPDGVTVSNILFELNRLYTAMTCNDSSSPRCIMPNKFTACPYGVIDNDVVDYLADDKAMFGVIDDDGLLDLMNRQLSTKTCVTLLAKINLILGSILIPYDPHTLSQTVTNTTAWRNLYYDQLNKVIDPKTVTAEQLRGVFIDEFEAGQQEESDNGKDTQQKQQ